MRVSERKRERRRLTDKSDTLQTDRVEESLANSLPGGPGARLTNTPVSPSKLPPLLSGNLLPLGNPWSWPPITRRRRLFASTEENPELVFAPTSPKEQPGAG